MENKGICNFCVMDVSAGIVFDDTGRCNFCKDAEREWSFVKQQQFYANFVSFVPKNAKAKYDCLIGLSGGVDSAYTLHQAVKQGLRPLCFSIDTGYNKPEADENIMRMVETLKVPFYRYTINLKHFHALQAAFLASGVRNIEIPTDHILMAASYELASRYGIKTILSGGNVATESIMPASWGYNARDLTHIKAIYRGSLKGLPTCSVWKWNYYRWVKKISIIYLLDYFSYNRATAEKVLIDTYGFQSTGEKHEENFFTWWFQNYYLFEKFGIDKRKAHYSSMIVSGQMTRDEALAKLQQRLVYPELGLEKRALKYKRHEHTDYQMDKWYPRIAKVVKYVTI